MHRSGHKYLGIGCNNTFATLNVEYIMQIYLSTHSCALAVWNSKTVKILQLLNFTDLDAHSLC